MSSERWQRLYEIFDQVVELPVEERRPALDRVCDDDAALRHAVESLLDADSAGSVMEGLLRGETESTESALPLTASRLGPYRILHRVGRGGMSTVYLGLRDDDVFKRQVAIKIIPWGFGNSQLAEHLRAERQILAGLDHPYIAKIYDGGTTSEGLPYFVMEYVEGLPIETYCDHNELSLTDRLRLFAKVCAAVHYAHQNLVVHRDLKPSNILVNAVGEPRLLDFGIAKVLKPDLVARDAETASHRLGVLTPHYASPEQLRGQPVTTASDVYSLGVLLHQLLTGCLPRRYEGLSRQQIDQLLATAESCLPSRVFAPGSTSVPAAELAVISRARSASPKQLHRLLRGDLDAIVAKALDNVAQRRYGSAAELAADLQRSLDHWPVVARPRTPPYLLGMLLRRRRWAILAALLLASMMVLFGWLLVEQSVRLAQERDQARLDRDQKTEIIGLVEEIFKAADPEEGDPEMTVRQALDRGGELIDRRLGGQPYVDATLRGTIGTIYLNLGLPVEAELHLRRSLDLRRELYGADSAEAADGLRALSAALREQGSYERAEELARQALALSRQRLGNEHPGIIKPLNNLVTVQCYREDFDNALVASTEALAKARQLLGEVDPELAAAVTNRAYLASQLGDQQTAVEMYRESLRVQRYLLGDDSPQVANILNNLAVALHRQRDLPAAEEIHREVLSLRRRIYAGEHPAVVHSLANLGAVLRERGELEAAEQSYREALELSSRLLGRDHSHTLRSAVGLAAALNESGEAPAAEQLLRGFLVGWRQRLAADSPFLALAEGALGECLMVQGRYQEAALLLERSHRILEQQLGSTHRRTRRAATRLADLDEVRGRLAEDLDLPLPDGD